MTTTVERHADDFSRICGSCNDWLELPIPEFEHAYQWRPTGHPVILFDVRGCERTIIRSNGWPYRVRGGRILKPTRAQDGTLYYRLGTGRAGRHKWLTINASTLERLYAATAAADDQAAA